MSEEKRCAVCGATEDLVLHHEDAVHGALLPNAVVWLCRRHHAQVHAKHDLRFFKLEEAARELRRLLKDEDR